MFKFTKEGEKWLESEFGSKNIHDLHVRVKGWKCRMACAYCKCCHGQIKLENKPAAPGDVIISAGGYNFSVAPALLEKAQSFWLDACGGIPMVRPEKPIFTI